MDKYCAKNGEKKTFNGRFNGQNLRGKSALTDERGRWQKFQSGACVCTAIADSGLKRFYL